MSLFNAYVEFYLDTYGAGIPAEVAEIVYVPEDVIRSSFIRAEFGVDLLDSEDNLVADISDSVVGGELSRDSYATIHGTAKLELSEAYSWHNQRFRPWIRLTDEVTGATFQWNMGVYLANTPETVGGKLPQRFQVECYDKLIVLDTPIGATYQVAAGTTYIDAVEALIELAGEGLYNIDQTKASVQLPTARTWAIDEKNTYLAVINDLLAAIGYRALWVDRDGLYTAKPFVALASESVTFVYDTEVSNTVVLEDFSVGSDLHDVPNRWVFIRDDPEQALPTEGAGVYTVVNANDGITSIASRGRTITRIVRLDVADQASLELSGDRIAQEDRSPNVYLSMGSTLNPLHWHRDLVRVNAPHGGIVESRFVEKSWRMSLTNPKMQHEFRAVA